MNPTPPLNGIKVLDFTHVLAGPFCTRLLADFGADVVRVESTRHPDYPWPSSYIHADGRHASYLNTNRSKRSVAIDLKHEAGRAIALRLATAADLVVENFSAGVMSRLGLGYETLKALNPRLIYVGMSGYGNTGPRRDWTSMNMNLQGYGGLMLTTGAEKDPPIAISNSWNDYIGGLHACFGIIEALAQRETTGSGAHLDLSQFECSVSLIAPLVLSSAVNKSSPKRLGNRSARYAPQGVYRCDGRDEWCAISIQNDEQWRALTAAMGNPELGSEARFANVCERMRHHDEIDRRIEAWTSQLPNTEVEKRLRSAGIPAERMRRIQDIVDAPDRSKAFARAEEPRVGSMLTTTLPLSLSFSPSAPFRPAPKLGEHTQEVLKDWLGIPDSELVELNERGALV
ncbi:MAG: CoA transferase [Deltaproteobacteria bacterium]|nr:CoA transferase [Deltaproteobacteria bacterium]